MRFFTKHNSNPAKSAVSVLLKAMVVALLLTTGMKTETYAAYAIGNNAVAAASVCPGAVQVPIHSFSIAVTGATNNMTGFRFVTTGTYVPADIIRFQLWRGTTNSLAAATQVGTNLAPGAVGTQTFAAFTTAMTTGTTYYFWVTMDAAAAPTAGHTIKVNGTLTTNTTPTSNSTASVASGTQTFAANPTVSAGSPFTKTCSSNANGAVIGETPVSGFAYHWLPTAGLSNANIANPTANPTVTTTYTVYKTSLSSGCAASATVTVTVTGTTLTPTINNIGGTFFLCGGSTKLYTATAYASWVWSTGATTDTITVVTGGAYRVTVTDANGCTGTATRNVTTFLNPQPVINASGPTTFACPGSVNLYLSTVYGSYHWSTGATTDTITATTGGTYTVTVTTTGGCTGVANRTVTVTPVAVTVSANGPTTFNCGGNVKLYANTTFSSYLWSTGATTDTITVITGGTYTLTVTNAQGCTGTANRVVTVNLTTALAIGANGPTTFTCGGNVKLYATTLFSTYLWSTGATTDTITVTAGGNYTLTVTTANGCTASATRAVTVNAIATPTVTASGPTTFTCGGFVKLYTSTLYTSWLWSNGSTTDTIVVTTAGNYRVTVTNAAGCTAVSANTAITVNAIAAPTIGSVGPLTFTCGSSVKLYTTSLYNGWLWSNGATTDTVTIAAAGNYRVTVTNAVGCTARSTFTTVTVTPITAPTINASGPTTFACPGSVKLYTSTLYTGWHWSTGATTDTITVTQTGNYVVTVTNNAGCTNTQTRTVTVTPPIVAIGASGPTTFCTGGSVRLYTTTSFTSWVWSTGATTDTISITTVGTYRVTVTTGNGCTATATQVVTVNANPNPTINVNGPTSFCQGGTVTLTVAGFYTAYHWSTGATTNNIVVNASGTYTVTVTNNTGCTGTNFRTITVYPAPTPTITANGPTTFCVGGSVQLSTQTFSTYNWSNGATTNTINVTTAGTYRVTVTSAQGCTATATQVIVVNPSPTPVISASGPTTFCNGGSVFLSSAGYSSYLWTSGSTVNTILVTTGGTYIVTVTNANGCTGTATQIVTVNNATTASITPSGPTNFCTGGSVNLSANASTSYLWSNAATTQAITVNSTGTYTVTITGNTGCTATASQIVNVTSSLSTSITPSGPTTICDGNSVTLDAGTYTNYVWSTGASTQTISPTTSGTYSVTVTASAGCTGTATQTITVNANPVPTITPYSSTTFCIGGNVHLDAGAFNSYSWSTGATNEIVTATTSGNYVVTVSNASGCTATASQAVTVNPLATPVITANGPLNFCAGGNVTLDAGTYNAYIWSNGNNTHATTVNTTGTYTVTVTDANGCTGTASQAVVQSAVLVPTISVSGPTTFCTGGSVTLDAGNYTSFEWSNAATTQTINVTTSGSYVVTVTNTGGCSGTGTQVVTVNTIPSPVITASGPTTFCVGGSVNLTTGNYSGYNWSTGETTQTITVSTQNSYTVTITDNNGCISSASQSIVVNANPTPSITAAGPTTFCSGGSVSLDAGTYTGYSWSNSSTTETTTAAANGNYVVTVTDNNGCHGSTTVAITVNALPTPTITPDGPINFCPGGTVHLDGGLYNLFMWSTGATTEVITASASATYVVTVTDLNGCTATTSLVIVNFTPPAPSITSSGPTTFCAGGSVNLDAGSYIDYTWSTGSSVEVITTNTAGTYTVTVTDGNGCVGSGSATISINALPTPTITANGPTTFCSGGSVVLDAGAYSSYVWNNANTSQTITVNAAGTYDVTVTDNNGCSATATQDVIVNFNPTPTITANGPTTFCDGGSVTLDAGTYISYNWSTTQTSETINVINSNTYIATVTDVNGCTGTASQAVTVNPLPNVTIDTSGSTTFCSTGSLTLHAGTWAGYHWSTGATIDSIVVNTSGNYIVTVTNGNGCTSSASITATVLTAPTVSLTLNQHLVCINWPIFSLGGGAPSGGFYTGASVSAGQFNPAIAGVGAHGITYTYTDGQGCSNTAVDSITVNACTDVPALNNGFFVNVFPNPNDGNFTVDYKLESNITAIIITDIAGRLVYSKAINGMEGSQVINAAAMSKGIYYYQLNAGNNVIANGKMVIIK